MNNINPAIKITNLTNEIMRDIKITYDGLQDIIEILKIKKEYEKTVFLDKCIDKNIKNLKLICANGEFLIEEEITCKKELVIDIKITADHIEINYI